jgi:hypothetical protein
MTTLDCIFWTSPDSDDDVRPTDPLGLDAMREQLSDRLVPCLTGRTWSNEEFFWTLVFLRWVGEEEQTYEARVRLFLHWERCLKMYWAHIKKGEFSGITKAYAQAGEKNAPSTRPFRPLLKNQQAQGMLGTHLGPLRQLGLAADVGLALTDEGRTLVVGVGSAPKLLDGDWGSWTRGFKRARKAFDGRFKERFRKRLWKAMPHLRKALSTVRWKRKQAWKEASRHIGKELSPYAKLAGEFCTWSYIVRKIFQDLVHMSPKDLAPRLPPPLSTRIPSDLTRWKPLKKALKNWHQKSTDQILADLHKLVFREKGYERDLWLMYEDGRRIPYPARASSNFVTEGSDCRWANAVQLMKSGNDSAEKYL